MPYIIIYLEKTLGITDYAIPLGVILILSAVISVLLGRVIDRFGKIRCLLPSAAVLIIGFSLMYFANGSNMPVLMIFGTVMMGAYLVSSACICGTIRDYTPQDKIGLFQGVRIVFQVLIPMVTGPYIGAAVGALVLAAAVGIAVSAVFARRMSGSISARLGEINNRLHALTLTTPGTSAAGGDEFAEIAEEIDALVAGLGGSLADLRREQSKLDFVINNISQGMMAFSSHNEIVLYNKPVCKIFKVKDDIMGKHFSYLTKDEELKTLMHNALMRGEDGEFSYRLRGKDLNFKVYSFKTDDESGEIEHIVLVADLTKEKAAIRQKSEFFANASHELKTPLTTMQGLTEILLAKAGDEGQKKQLERIYKESKRLSFLVQDMLYISDLESGRAERREEDIDLGAVAAEVRQEYSHQAEERDVTINVSGSGHVRADYRNIYEIVGNLCSNAVHYNVPGGKVDMDIRTEDGRAVLTVSDTGIGIPEEHLPKVCERFYRVDKSRSKKTGGTGLGLAIVKHVCNLYGAKLNIQSKVGEGTTVQVVFSPAEDRNK